MAKPPAPATRPQPIFSQNYSSPVAKAVRDQKNVPGGSGILGPTASFDPASVKGNAFLSAYLDNNDVIGKGLQNKNFTQEEANVATRQFEDAAKTGFSTNFDSGVTPFANDFAAKYNQGITRGIIPEDEAVTRNGIDWAVGKDPAERLAGTLNKSHLNSYAGSGGTRVS